MHGRVAADSKHSPNNAALFLAIPPALLAETGIHGTCPDACRITVVGDADVDLWSISTEARIIAGTPVPADQPFQHLNDR